MKTERMVLQSTDGYTFTANVSVENEQVAVRPLGYLFSFPYQFSGESVRQIATRLIEMIDAEAPKQ